MKISTLIYIEKVLKENAGFDERMYNHSCEVVARMKKRHDFDEDFTAKEQRELEEAKADRDRLREKHLKSSNAYDDFLSHDFR